MSDYFYARPGGTLSGGAIPSRCQLHGNPKIKVGALMPRFPAFTMALEFAPTLYYGKRKALFTDGNLPD